jgi:hypothetical protein
MLKSSLLLPQLTLANNTLVNSNSTGPGIRNTGSLLLANSIVSGNTGVITGEIYGFYTAEGANIVRSQGNGTVAGTGTVGTADPLLAELAFNGGYTQTMRFQPGSPALNAGLNRVANSAGLTTDQRGTNCARFFGAQVDLGAYEENNQALTISFTPTSVFEGSSLSSTVTRSGGNNTGSLLVTLTGLNPLEFTAPATITLPAGAASASFNLTTSDDGLLDGNQTVGLREAASGYQTNTGSFTVLDAAKFFTVTMSPTTILENGGVLTGVTRGTVTRAPFTVGAVTVNLVSNDPSSATVPATVVIPDGATSVTFPVTAVDDALLEPAITVTITANSSGFFNGTGTVSVVSDEGSPIVVDLNNDISDGNTTAGNVSLREAAALAASSTAQPSVITFNTAVGSPFAGPGRAVILLNSSLDIGANLTIRAPSTGVILDRQSLGRVMNNTGGKFIRLENLTLKNGLFRAGGAAGGGILNSANLTLVNCTLTGKSSAGGGATGGAIQQSSGTLGLFNGTVSVNPASTNGDGGGLYPAGGITRIVHSTITGNSPDGISGSGSLSVINSIVHNNNGSSIEGNYTLEGVSIITGGAGTSSGSGTKLTGDPLLGALANNGGPSDTQLPGAGSPALDAGMNAGAAGLATDQRGLARLSGAAVDTGSVEVQATGITYAAWAATAFPNGTSQANQAFDVDLDKDGQANGLEFYFGTNPAVREASPFTLTRNTNAGLLRVTFPHLIGATLTGAAFQWSSDPANWSRTGVTFGTPGALSGGRELLETRVPLNGAAKLFVREKITP